jgi:PilZ domain
VPDASSPLNRRQIKRHPRFESSVTFTASTGDVVVASLLDLSVIGMGILSHQYFSVGTQLNIHVPATFQKITNFLPAVVRHATVQAEGNWVLGCALLRFLTVDEISALK